jgi:predicted transcriptional regulator
MKTLEKIKEYSWVITLFLLLVIFMRQCGTNRDIDRIEKNVKAINANVDSLQNSAISGEEVEKKMNKVMFDFLIYEDDFDKGKSSLSDIKSKIKISEDAK